MTLSESALKILENALDLLNKTINYPKAQGNIGQEARNHLNKYPVVKEELFPTGLYAEPNWTHISIAVVATLVVGRVVIVPIIQKVIANFCSVKKLGPRPREKEFYSLQIQSVREDESEEEIENLEERLARLRDDGLITSERSSTNIISDKLPRPRSLHGSEELLKDTPQTFVQEIQELPFIDKSNSRASSIGNNNTIRDQIKLPAAQV